MLINYQGSIVALHIQLHGREDFLIEQRMDFGLLEILSVDLREAVEPINQKNITESLLVKHASKLKKLSVQDWEMIDELNIPTLSALESLTVQGFRPEIAWLLYTASKQTIKSLNIGGISLNTQLPINNADENETAYIYQVPNLQNLNFCYSSFGWDSMFLSSNANNLVSLTLMGGDLPSGGMPELPKLRELNMYYYRGIHYPVFSKCTDLLKCLVLHHSSLDGYDVTMHQLTDLYIADSYGSVRCGKFLSFIHKSLEFLFLQGIGPKSITLDDGVRLDRVVTVVINPMYGYNYVYTDEEMSRMAEMCPNAEILIFDENNRDEMTDFIISRHKRRGFKTNLNKFIRRRIYREMY